MIRLLTVPLGSERGDGDASRRDGFWVQKKSPRLAVPRWWHGPMGPDPGEMAPHQGLCPLDTKVISAVLDLVRHGGKTLQAAVKSHST